MLPKMEKAGCKKVPQYLDTHKLVTGYLAACLLSFSSLTWF